MSTAVKKYRRETGVVKGLMFVPEMYTNIFGSLIVTHYILSENKPSVEFINKRWQQLVEEGTDLWINDEHFFEKLLTIFEMTPKYGLFAMIQSNINCLFMPYIDGEVLPIREDGFLPATARHGKIYPIIEKENE